MRPVLHGDVVFAARALLGVPGAKRADVARTIIQNAQSADRHCRETGRVHRIYGDGSLLASASCWHLPAEPGFDDDEYCACFELVLRSLLEYRVTRKRN